MIVNMSASATKEQIQHVMDRIKECGFLPHVIEGAERTVIGVVGKNRLPQLPDVPTMAEAGYPETNVASWYGYCVPKGTPQEIVDKIVAAFAVALKDASVRSQLERQITEVMEPKTSAELQAMYAADADKYAKVIQDANIHIQE